MGGAQGLVACKTDGEAVRAWKRRKVHHTATPSSDTLVLVHSHYAPYDPKDTICPCSHPAGRSRHLHRQRRLARTCYMLSHEPSHSLLPHPYRPLPPPAPTAAPSSSHLPVHKHQISLKPLSLHPAPAPCCCPHPAGRCRHLHRQWRLPVRGAVPLAAQLRRRRQRQDGGRHARLCRRHRTPGGSVGGAPRLEVTDAPGWRAGSN